MSDGVSRVWNRLMLLIGRGRVNTVDDSGNVQKMQAQLGADEIVDNIARLAEYGFTSNPPPGSDVVIAFIAGERSNGVVIATGNQKFRMKALASGDVAIYDLRGQSVLLGPGGIRMTAPVAESSGDLVSGGNLLAGTGASGSFTTPTGLTVDVQDGIVINIF